MRMPLPSWIALLPLAFALHGAGGSENLFFDGYGGGRLLAIARDRGIAVVCPPTIPFGLSPNVLTRFLEELRKDVPFDPARVGLVGHSLGAVTASRLAMMRPDAVNGAVCIAGFADLPRRGDAPARRVYHAELDPLFPFEGTRAMVENAKARGEDIELVTVANEGHTLVVGEVLDQAIDWLLARPACQSATTKPNASAPVTSPMNTGVLRSAPSESNPSPGPTK
jgi:pimeloyl-ACP methyl ester carboxylesterase